MAAFQYFPSPSLPFVHPIAPPPLPHVVPPPPPHVVPHPPQPHVVPPPPPHVIPHPPRPHVLPPPPPHVIPHPPRPHVVPPPPPFHPIAPPPHVHPPPPPDNAPTVVIVIFVSFGCFFFAAFCCFALWCLIKNKKHKKMVNETDIIRTEEHLRVKEAITQGPNGPELVVLSIEDDKHTQEEIIKNEKMERKHLHANAKSGEIAATDHLL